MSVGHPRMKYRRMSLFSGIAQWYNITTLENSLKQTLFHTEEIPFLHPWRNNEIKTL